MANRLFGQKGLEFNDAFLTKTKEYFRAKMEALNFKNDPSGSRTKINSWVASVTSGKIKELFPKGAISRETVLALANAVYFKGSWLYKFNRKTTKPQIFSASRDQKIQVPMVHLKRSGGLRYTTSDYGFRLLELPYSDKNVSMIIALDQRNDNFNSLLRDRLIDSPWEEFVHVSTNAEVLLSLPKFKLQKSVDLIKPLQAIGIKNLFGRADLSGIVDSVPLVLSNAFHKAYIAVDEDGTEAAGATGFGVIPVSLDTSKDEIIDFTVDREFLFLVVEKTTGCILFFGHVKNPLESN